MKMGTKRFIVVATTMALMLSLCTFAMYSSGFFNASSVDVYGGESSSAVNVDVSTASGGHYFYPTIEQRPAMQDQINSISAANAQPMYAFPPIETLTPVEPVEGKVCYLTFDDGPSDHTLQILEILDSYDVKATFFVMNNPSYNQYMDDIVQSGNTIALHTYSHVYSQIYASEEAYFNDLESIRQLVYDQTGVNSNIVRMPGGSSNMVSAQYSTGIMTGITQKLGDSGYVYFDWTVDSEDSATQNPSKDEIIQNVVDSYSGQQTVNLLMHDTSVKDGTVEALPYIIEFYRSKGYTFDVIDASTPPVHHTINN